MARMAQEEAAEHDPWEEVIADHIRHSERDRIVRIANWMAGLSASLGKIGEDLSLLTQSELAEVSLSDGGSSSTMPQKQNPVGPALLTALGRQNIGLVGLIQGAALHRHQRDGAAWFTEWLTLPQLCNSTGRALSLAGDLAERIVPDADAMAHGMDDGLGLIYAETLSFMLAQRIPRAEAQAAIKSLCIEARKTNQPLTDLLRRDFAGHTDIVLTDPEVLGQAPAEARTFVAAARGVRWG